MAKRQRRINNMKQYIETIGRVFPIDAYPYGFTRDFTQGIYSLRFFTDASEDNYYAVEFESSRGRDAAYHEIVSNLGRSILISIARYQDWTSNK